MAATPIGVGDRVLAETRRGLMLVPGTGDELEVIARNEFGEEIVASPAVIDNTLYLRTGGHLHANWGIGKPGPELAKGRVLFSNPPLVHPGDAFNS